jgi:hypothetical protein
LEFPQRDFVVDGFADFDAWVAFAPDAPLLVGLVAAGFSVT